LKKHLDPDLSFRTGYVANRNLVVIVAEQDKFAESRPHSFLFFFQNGKWNKMVIDWPVISVGEFGAEQTLISLGVDGRVHLAGRRGVSTERIAGPENAGVLSAIRAISGQPYAVGMARQAYVRRDGIGAPIDEGARQSIADDAVRGFLAIDGFGANDIYAVGYAGEIWHFDGARWSNLPSPTNLHLNTIRCAAPDRVYAAGQRGIVIRGSGTRWEILGEGQIADEIWGCEVFRDRLYVSTSKNVYAFDDKKFAIEDIGLSATGAASKLHANDGVLWSFGTKFLSYTEGTSWIPVSIPRR
jgi:hypothetical protein